jgi:Na+-transporting NADH:ubiquinone oxidoreductase subunit NqrD
VVPGTIGHSKTFGFGVVVVVNGVVVTVVGAGVVLGVGAFGSQVTSSGKVHHKLLMSQKKPDAQDRGMGVPLWQTK